MNRVRMGRAASLRARLTLVLVLVNLVVLGALAVWAERDEGQRRLDRLARQDLLERSLREALGSIQADEADDLAGILRSSLWRGFADAVVVDRAAGAAPGAVFLNPLGARRRAPDFPLDEVRAAIDRAIEEGEPRHLAGGVAMPLITRGAAGGRPRLWGGVFVRPRTAPAMVPLALRITLFALAATALGAGLVYLLVGRLVLRPVERLARSAREFGEGREPGLPPAGGAREVDELVRAFAAMMERIRGFQAELEREVARATARAAEAERRAARQERLAAMGTLAAGLAHEINSPLTGALHGLEVLRRDAAGQRAERYGALVQEALERIAGLVRRLLQLAPARPEAGSCALDAVARDLPDFLASRLERHELVLDLPAEELRVAAAAGDLFPLLLNLVQNALDALDDAGRPGRVELRARGEQGLARIRIRDDGPGVPPELLPHLFEPFVTTKEVGRGTGLGLALAHATLRQLGGRIEAGNRPEGGLEVRIELPLADS
ncbi:MAG: sensor histidine kinase [Planctomycetota bacterium]|nr:MAG: sensor histidine kinase [Planctomycetota bacterium]